MVRDIDILRSAKVLIDRYGANRAWFEAVDRMEALAMIGDDKGVDVYCRIACAITALGREPGEAIH